MSVPLSLPMVAKSDSAQGLHPSLKSVLLRLCVDADQMGSDVSCMSVADLAKATGFSVRGVRRALSLLADKGYILRTGAPGDHIWQTLVAPPAVQESEIVSRRRRNISADKRRRIMERDQYRCRACGDHRKLSIDHIIPFCRGGSNADDNLQVLCQPCNQKKGAEA